MTDPVPSPIPSGEPPPPVAETPLTRVIGGGRGAGASALAPVRPSALLSERPTRPAMAGRFIITGEIARGGMGVIYRGHDPDLGRDLAIKVLKPDQIEQPDSLAMFLEEARICGRLQHPGIVPIHELGTMANGSPFIAMKLVEGQTFAQLLAERGRSAHELQRILRIFEVVCQTLAYAHARGVIHRDLTPSNIMVGPFNEVQVMDWGLACEVFAHPDDPCPDERRPVMGTPAYMAPERARGDAPPDVRVDVFALGAILCEILTGKPPFEEGDGATLDRVRNGETQPALDRLHDEGLDADLVDLACRCLSVDPERRPADAGHVATAIGDQQAGVQERLHQAELQRTAADARAVGEHGSRRLLIGLVVVILLASLSGLIGWDRSRRARFDFLAERSAHLADETRTIDAALDEARLLRSEARGRWGDPGRWEATLARARAAVERAAGLVADDEALDARKPAVDEARLGIEADDRDRRLVLTLDRIRISKTDGHFDLGGAIRRYEQAFAESGIDPFGEPIEGMADLIRERPIRVYLAEAVEDWACLLEPGQERRHRLLAIADRVEPHPWRDRLRDALRTNDRPRLVRLAEEASPSLPPACQVRLANALVSQGESDRAIDLLRRVRERHPGNFWVNYQLGYRLHRAGQGSLVEALRYYTAAQALRQDSPGLFLEIAAVLAKLGRAREAEVAARKALALDPEPTGAR